jgi:L-cysteine desulfidase
VLITKDDEIIYQNQECDQIKASGLTDRSMMNVKDILEFAESVDLSHVEDLLQRQIDYNTRIAEEGLRGNWGANIGSVLLDVWGNDIKVRAKALAAAGSDARMSGCELPVVIVSGSGNQGITASVPVIEFAKELGVDKDTLFRALVVSNLITIHQKTGIGRLSAYCGAVSAGIGAGAGIARLHGGRFKETAHTIVNALAIVSGIICDGAKPSCAAKIAFSVEAGILGFYMYQKGKQFYGGDGIITKGVENTIANIGRLGRDGMRETDKEIIRIMMGD